MRKYIPWMIGVAGIVSLALGLAADQLGIGGQAGLGPRQISFIFIGAFFILCGTFLALPKGRQTTDQSIQKLESLKAGPGNPRETLLNCLIMAAWFGLVTGLLEGIALWIFRRLGWLTGIYYYLGNSLEIVWIATAFDLVFFGLVGLAVNLVGRVFKGLPVFLLGIYLFIWMAILDVSVLLLNRWLDFYPLLILTAGVAIWPARWLVRKQEAALIFWRRSLPWIAGMSLVAFMVIQGGFWLREKIAVARLPDAKPNSPNIVVIVVDALRADHLSSYGYDRQTSLNIDRLASEGVIFENAISTSSWTPPAHASLFTGRYVYEHGADLKPLDDRYPTIAEEMQKLGYRTGAFMGNYDTLNRLEGMARGFQHYEDYYQSLSSLVDGTLFGHLIIYEGLHQIFGLQYKFGRKLASQLNSSTLDWISHDKVRPFFAFINYFDVHAPYIPPQPYRSKFSTVENPGGLINTDWDMNHIYVLSTPEQLQEEVDAYDGAIAYVDDSIDQLLNEMQNHKLVENTIFVILSDHGESFGEHGLLEHHNSLYWEVVHVPIIIWGPAYFTGGRRITEPVSITAIPATLLRIASDGQQKAFPEYTLASLWIESLANTDMPAPIAEVAQAEWLPEQHLPHSGDMRAGFISNWHYIEHEEYGEELYNWVADPEEANNLIDQSQFQSFVNQFRSSIALITEDH